MKKMNKWIVAVLMFVLAVPAFAQNSGMEESFYASGKIKIVIAMASLVMFGLLVYLIIIDLRLRKIEKKD
jgi:hypothetical protein